MPFSKAFPKTAKGSNYPVWEEIYLTEEEERLQEISCRQENIKIMVQCMSDAKKILEQQNLKRFQSDLVRIAIALFEKRASHEIYWKEEKAKIKFDKNAK